MQRAFGRQVTAVFALTLLFTVGSAASAAAQGYISPFLGFNFGGDSGCPEVTGCEDKNLNAGVSLGTMGSVFGFEEEFGYARNFFGEAEGLSSSVLTVMSNVMINPAVGPIRPYFLTGIGLIKTHVELTPSSLLEADHNSLGWDIGGGVMGFFGDHVGVRGEIRYFHAFKDIEILGVGVDNEKIDFGRAAAGLVLKF